VRPMPDARVSTPITWDEVPTVDPAAFTLRTVPDRLRAVGDPGAGIETTPAGTLDALLRLAEEQAAEGLGDAPWPPHFEKGEDEPPRVAPSRRRQPKYPLIEIARAATKDEALAGLERWKDRHPAAATHLVASDVLVDSMRGRSTTWTRIRVNLRNVPVEERPEQEMLEVDYDPWEGVSWSSDQAQDGGSSPS